MHSPLLPRGVVPYMVRSPGEHRRSGNKWSLVGVLGIAGLLSVYGLWWALPSTTEPDPDSSVPLTALRGAACGFANGWVGQHQPLQPMIIATLSAPYLGYLLVTGGLDRHAVKRAYPYGLKDPITSLSVVILIGRLLSAVAYLALVWVLYQIGLLLRDQTTGVILAALAATCYPFVYYGHVGNPDMLFTALLTGALYSYLLSLHSPNLSTVSVLACTAALAASVKIQALPFVTGLAPAVGYAVFRQSHGTRGAYRSVLPRRIGVLSGGLLVFLATFAVANNLVFNAEGFRTWLMGKQQGMRYSQQVSAQLEQATGGPGFATRTAQNLMAGMGAPVLVLSLFGICVGVARHRCETAAILSPFITYGVFYWKVHADYVRYMFPCILILLLFAALAVASMADGLRRIRGGNWFAVTAGVLLGCFLLSRAIGILWLMTHGSRYQVEAWLATHASHRMVTLEVHQPVNLRLPPVVHLAAFDPYSYFASQRANADPRKVLNPYGWQVPAEVIGMASVRRRAPEFLLLLPGKDDDLISSLDRAAEEYALVAQFGGPTRLIRQPLFANPRMMLYQRQGPVRSPGEVDRP